MKLEGPYPRVWGNGQFFVFSALDGRTDWRNPFVGQTVGDPPGILFHSGVEPAREFKISFAALLGDSLHTQEFRKVEPSVVGPDVLEIELGGDRWQVGFRLVFYDRKTVLGTATGTGALPCMVLRAATRVGGHFPVITPSAVEDESSVLVFDREQKDLAICMDEGQVEDAERVLQSTSVSSLFAQRLNFYHSLPRPRTDDESVISTFLKACAVMKANVESPCGSIGTRWTTPDRWPHRHMWLWDSALHSIGSFYVDRELSKDCIRSVLTKQRKDGFIPHTMAPDSRYDSNMTQPPLLAWTSWLIYQRTRDASFISEVYPKISSYLKWIMANMDKLRTGLLQWEHPGPDSGMDNSPRFDEGYEFDAVDLNCFVANEMEHLGRMARSIGRGSDAEYWVEARRDIASRIERRLWRQEKGLYYDRRGDGSWVDVMTVDHFLPLFCGVTSRERAEIMVRNHLLNPEEFLTPFPVPSVSLRDDHFELDMWRGPTWINYNYLIILGLKRYGYDEEASSLARRTIDEIVRWRKVGGSIYEFYDPFSQTAPWRLKRKGKVRPWRGDGIPVITDFFWSSSLLADLVSQTYGLERPKRADAPKR